MQQRNIMMDGDDNIINTPHLVSSKKNSLTPSIFEKSSITQVLNDSKEYLKRSKENLNYMRKSELIANK